MLIQFHSNASYDQEYSKHCIYSHEGCKSSQEHFYTRSEDPKKTKISKDFRKATFISKATEVLFSHFACNTGGYRMYPLYNSMCLYLLEKEVIELEERIGHYYSLRSAQIMSRTIWNHFAPIAITLPNTDISRGLHMNVRFPTEKDSIYAHESIKIPQDASYCCISPETILFFGGTSQESLSNSFILLHSDEESVSLVNPSPKAYISPRIGSAICAGNKIYLHGGTDANSAIQSNLFEIGLKIKSKIHPLRAMDVEISLQEIIADKQIPSSDHYLAYYARKLFVLGGNHHSLNSIDYLDVDTYSWHSLKIKSSLLKFPVLRNKKFKTCIQFGPVVMIDIDQYQYSNKKTHKTLCKNYPSTSAYSSHVIRYPQKLIYDLNLGLLSIHWDIYSRGSHTYEYSTRAFGNFIINYDNNSHCVFKTIPGPFYWCKLPRFSSEKISKSLVLALESSFLADTQVICEDGSFFVSKFFLAARGEMLRFLLSKIRENVLDVRPFNLELVKKVFLFLYADSLKIQEFNTKFIEDLMRFAETFEIHELSSIVTVMLIQESPVRCNKQNLINDYTRLKAEYVKINKQVHKGALLSSNICIEASEGSIYCHKEILLLRSGYFRRLSSFQEMKNLRLEEIDIFILELVINFLYFDNLDIPVDRLFQVLAAAAYLDIRSLFYHCERLIAMNTTPSLLPLAYTTAKSYNAQQLVEFSKDFMGAFGKLVVKQEAFQDLREQDIDTYRELSEIYSASKAKVKFRPLKACDIPAENLQAEINAYLQEFPPIDYEYETAPGFEDFEWLGNWKSYTLDEFSVYSYREIEREDTQEMTSSDEETPRPNIFRMLSNDD